MSPPDLEPDPPPDLSSRLDALLQEVRRQGRAAVAAQAAAEACLAAVQDSPRAPPPAPAPSSAEARSWLGALIPVLDTLDASKLQAERLDQELRRARWLGVLAPVRRVVDDVRAFLHGLELVRQQADQALAGLGVEVDRRVGGPVDPLRHRVLELRPGPRSSAGRVVEVVRAGYFVGPECVREAEVRAGDAGPPR